VRNLEILNNSTDAKGRKLEVYKVHVPPPLFRTYRESEGVHVSPCTSIYTSVLATLGAGNCVTRHRCSEPRKPAVSMRLLSRDTQAVVTLSLGHRHSALGTDTLILLLQDIILGARAQLMPS